MLGSTSIRFFRSLVEVDLDLGPFTVLIGANASGKSNVVDALGLIHDSLTDELETAVTRRGGRDALLWFGAEADSFSMSVDYRPIPNRAPTTYSVRIGFDDDLRPVVDEERLYLKKSGGKERRGRRRLALDAHHGAGRVFDETIGDRRQITGDPHGLQVAALGLFEDHPQVKELRDFVGGWKFLRIDVDAIRQPRDFQRSEALESGGGNLGVVLHTMQVHRPEALEAVNDMLSALIPGGPVARPTVVGGKILLNFRQSLFGGRDIPATSVSDGTLRLLAYLTALQIAPKPSLICIEEPEHGLHPEAVTNLVDILRTAAAEDGIQVLLTTHSRDVLDEIGDVASVRVAEKQPDGSTRVSGVEGLVDEERWLTEFKLSELWQYHALGGMP